MKTNSNYYHPFKIGDVEIPNNLVLGPMAGVTDLPFRLLCHEQGAGLVVMEMVSAKAITYHNKKTRELMAVHSDEHPVALQLFGSEPDVIAQAIGEISDIDYDILDINMGCPVPKVTGNGEGSALMKNPSLIGEIVAAAVRASDKPVTVKIRKGYTEKNINAVECALAAEEAGASAIAVHGRTREQFYSGHADWSIIRRVREAVSIPVIGNGDVTDAASAIKLIDETGCDGVMIARGARGNPWIFREIAAGMQGMGIPERPSSREIYDMIIRHARLMNEVKGEYIAVREIRKHVAWYSAGIPGSARLRNLVSSVEDMASLEEICREIFGV
ncbi:tRNA dihydrouridine synthase DusB [Butyrivibrio sp. MC2013]|uniref:tRNA dihydrouridine synthase DusB n=1 Tax=Butyrivibrio sp. MC2013 TaxID=1280686 RepID=UPI00055B6537|nr:tRNA dihydrouridine synthase DusB [Butyrivibrio sp. MC2013]